MSNQVTDCALEQIEELQHYIFTCFSDISYHGSAVVAKVLYHAGYRKQSENEALEAIDKFRSALMDKFIDLCRGNDFNKINLLLIGETIDRTFDDAVAKMKGGE